MSVFDESLDRISRGGEAVFAVDGLKRIILWSKACEALLGKSARSVMGKPCYDVMRGRDSNGNLYCHRSCAIAYQACEKKDDPVHRFELLVPADNGKKKTISTSVFAIASYHPALTTLVHILRESESQPAVETARSSAVEPLTRLVNERGELVTMTSREKDVLRCLAQGMSTGAIAKKLFIAAVTVRNHIQNILQKLDVHSKLQAVVLANKHRLV